MEKKNNSLRRRGVPSSVLFGFLAILLCAPNVRAQYVVEVIDDGEEREIKTHVADYLDIYGTANLDKDAHVTVDIYAYPGKEPNDPGAIVNIKGCAPGNTLNVLLPGTVGGRFGELPAVVTIYGPKFMIGTGASFYPTNDPIDDVPINTTLSVLNESNELLFSLLIYSDSDIRLRSPGSTEKQRIEAELCVMPKVMYRHRRRPIIFTTLRLPEDITKDDVDNDYRLVLYADDNEVGVEASRQRIYQSCRRRKTSRVKIFAFFNIGTLLEAIPDNCEEMQIQVCGKLKSGQEFYGKGDIKILSPRKKRWKHWSRRSSKYRHR